MISKKHRLTEKQVKKVLRYKKPFFSYGIVLNYSKNRLGCNRFAIVIGSKSVPHNVARNFFRRRFYDLVVPHLEKSDGYDCVFVVKKQTKLDHKDSQNYKQFCNDVQFLLKKLFTNK